MANDIPPPELQELVDAFERTKTTAENWLQASALAGKIPLYPPG